MYPWIMPWPWCGSVAHTARHVVVIIVMVFAVVLAFHGENPIMIVSSSLLLLTGSVAFIHGRPGHHHRRGREELGDAG